MTDIRWQVSKGEINRAGKALISEIPSSEKYTTALEIINKWRASHKRPLQEISEELSKRASNIDPLAIFAYRLKRLPSIQDKLFRLKSTRLSSMQDIGGCRAILETPQQVYSLLEVYLDFESRKSNDKPSQITTVDYISQPKPSGYRSLHLIVSCESSETENIFPAHRIEIQIRSRLQHNWATAVETAAAFLGQGLKSSIGDRSWLRFFALASSIFAIAEGYPSIPNTPETESELVTELRTLWYELQVDAFLDGCRFVLGKVDEYEGSKTFLLLFDSKERKVDIKGFTEEEDESAANAYDEAENKHAHQAGIQVALVTVDNVSLLREAYPNYHADTEQFLAELMVRAIEPFIERYEESGKLDIEPDEDLGDLDRE